jgi:polyribonucleotide nucleotidyltransferase
MMMVNDILEGMVAAEVRRLIIEDKVRPDGRKVDEIRPLNAQSICFRAPMARHVHPRPDPGYLDHDLRAS